MNALPSDWTAQLQAAYPKRSGPCGWGGMKLMLGVRKALLNTDWETILHGVKGYKSFCEQAGIQGSTFVKTPVNFFEEGVYLEELTFQAKEDPKVSEAKRKEAKRWEEACGNAKRLGPPLSPWPQESIGAFESRVKMAATHEHRPAAVSRAADPVLRSSAADLHGRISSLANKLKSA